MTDQSYADFELLLELNPDWGIDSGVFLHTNEKGVCFQCYVDYHDHGNVGWLSTETTNGQKRMIIRPFNFFGKLGRDGKLVSLSTKPDERPVAWKPDYLLYSATAEQFLATWKIGDWNTLRIRCVGKYPHITTWINNVKMAEFDVRHLPPARLPQRRHLQTTRPPRPHRPSDPRHYKNVERSARSAAVQHPRQNVVKWTCPARRSMLAAILPLRRITTRWNYVKPSSLVPAVRQVFAQPSPSPAAPPDRNPEAPQENP